MRLLDTQLSSRHWELLGQRLAVVDRIDMTGLRLRHGGNTEAHEYTSIGRETGYSNIQ